MVDNMFKRRDKKNKTRSTVNLESDFATQEAFKALRTNLMFATPAEGCKKVIITSSIPEEGKSTICSNLGIVIAQMKERVLLIDCDLRAPTLHRFFKARVLPGLSEVLAGMRQADEVITPIGKTSLSILPAGTIPPNPAELLAGPSMDKLLEDLSEHYDYILLDTPPLGIVSDALNLTPKVHGTLVVTRAAVTEHKDIRRTLDQLEFANAKVLGLILNGSEDAKRSYGAYSAYGAVGKT